MDRRTRKVIYFVFSGGAVMLGWLAVLNFFFAVGRQDLAELGIRVVGSIGGVFGLISGYYALAKFPIARTIKRVALTVGIAVGCISLIAVLVVDGSFPPIDLQQGFMTAIWQIYVFVCPVVIAMALLVEIWRPGSSSAQDDRQDRPHVA